jgi:hypothetical protein
MLGNLLNALMQPGPGGQPSAGADILSQVAGGLMGGQAQGGGAPVNQLLSGLEQVIGGKPGTGQPLPLNQGSATDANNPLMGLLGPIATAVAGQVGVSPAIATTVAATALHYLVQSHPSVPGASPLNLGQVAQQMAAGGVSQQTLQSSGMVNAVVQATGMNQQEAAKTLDATFAHIATQVPNLKQEKRDAAAKRDRKNS